MLVFKIVTFEESAFDEEKKKNTNTNKNNRGAHTVLCFMDSIQLVHFLMHIACFIITCFFLY